MLPNEIITLHTTLVTEWRRAVADGNFERAIQLDAYHYDNLVKKHENVMFWNMWQKETLNDRNKLTQSLRSIVEKKNDSNKKERVAIVYHNFSGLAHETQLARNLRYFRKNVEDLDCRIIYLFGSENFIGAQEIFDVPRDNIYFLEASSYENAANKLSLLVNKIEFTNIIYPSIFYLAYWMSLFLNHNNQKFLQMKYYPLHTGRIKEWAGGQRDATEFYNINGCNFLQLPVLDLCVIGNDKVDIDKNRKSDIKYFGSISRPEKISDDKYNEFVKDLLNQLEGWRYLYAGRLESVQLIPSVVRDHANAQYLGWVNPLETIKNFSIYLEPFPWGGGDMTLLALQAGCPYLTLETDENKAFGIMQFLKIIAMNGRKILGFSFCKNKAELKNRFIKLSNDAELRMDLGLAWREAILSYRPSMIDNWKNFLLH